MAPIMSKYFHEQRRIAENATTHVTSPRQSALKRDELSLEQFQRAESVQMIDSAVQDAAHEALLRQVSGQRKIKDQYRLSSGPISRYGFSLAELLSQDTLALNLEETRLFLFQQQHLKNITFLLVLGLQKLLVKSLESVI